MPLYLQRLQWATHLLPLTPTTSPTFTAPLVGCLPLSPTIATIFTAPSVGYPHLPLTPTTSPIFTAPLVGCPTSTFEVARCHDPIMLCHYYSCNRLDERVLVHVFVFVLKCILGRLPLWYEVHVVDFGQELSGDRWWPGLKYSDRGGAPSDRQGDKCRHGHVRA